MMLKVAILAIIFHIPKIFSTHFDDEWHLVWEDEFDSPTIDTNLWTYELGDGCGRWVGSCGWGNSEKQSYTNSTENVFTSNGILVIQSNYIDGKYTSGRIRTEGNGNWKYGKIEIRAKFPKGDGLLPDIWLLPSYNNLGYWPTSGSIDIAVRHGYADKRKVATIAHYGNSMNDKIHDEKIHTIDSDKLDLTEEFYTYTLLWEENKLQWFIDDILYHSLEKAKISSYYDYPFNERFYLTLSLAVSGNGVETEVEETKFPQRLEFDYVRVYQKFVK